MQNSMKTAVGTLSLLLFFLFLSLPTLSLADSCHPHDLKTLRRIQQALGNPPELSSSWKRDKDCCSSWNYVVCNFGTGRVRVLNILGVDVSGQIPDAVGDLPYLDELFFNTLPNLTGQIPFALTRLTRLQDLRILSTSVSGPIPSFLGQIKSLTNLQLSGNRLSGSIPPSLSSLHNLQNLDLSRNRLTGVIPPSLSSLPSLQTLDLSRNRLTGMSFGHFVPHSIKSLDLSYNRLRGTVSRSLGYVNFTTINFSRNRLVGDVLFLFGENKTYQDVDLSWNKLAFNGSKLVVNSDLIVLDVNHNQITGNLPESLKDSNVVFFNASYNRMCGVIPKSRFPDNVDYTCYFHNRCLCGPPLSPCK